MGLKENVDAVKKELGAEEQFLESVIKAEGFFKKYKKLLIATGIVLVIGVLGYQGYKYTKQVSLEVSNEAYLTLQHDPENQEALKTLQSKNPALYELFLFSKEIKNQDAKSLETLYNTIKDPVLKDLVTYQKALLDSDIKQMENYAKSQDALLKDLAKLDTALLLFENNEAKKAKEVLSQISISSSLNQLAQTFSHFQK